LSEGRGSGKGQAAERGDQPRDASGREGGLQGGSRARVVRFESKLRGSDGRQYSARGLRPPATAATSGILWGNNLAAGASYYKNRISRFEKQVKKG
jgi:hypothetical protein